MLEDISELAGDNLGRAIVSAYAGKGYDAKCIRDYLRCHGINCRIYTKETQGKSHKTGIKSITARQGLSWNDSSHGPSAGFTEQQQDTKETVRIIWGLHIWHAS